MEWNWLRGFFFFFFFFFWGATSRDGRYAARDRSHAPTNSEQPKKKSKKKIFKKKTKRKVRGRRGRRGQPIYWSWIQKWKGYKITDCRPTTTTTKRNKRKRKSSFRFSKRKLREKTGSTLYYRPQIFVRGCISVFKIIRKWKKKLVLRTFRFRSDLSLNVSKLISSLWQHGFHWRNRLWVNSVSLFGG